MVENFAGHVDNQVEDMLEAFIADLGPPDALVFGLDLFSSSLAARQVTTHKLADRPKTLGPDLWDQQEFVIRRGSKIIKREYSPDDEAVCASRTKAARLPLPRKMPLLFKRKATVSALAVQADAFLPDLGIERD
jgi:hypothetical protein